MAGQRGPYTRESAADAVSALMGAIELVDDRYENYAALPAPVLIGDDFFNAGVVLGPEQTDWRDLDLPGMRGTLWIDGTERASGLGADILGDPLEALAWLANHRASIGKPLRAGSFVMLGSVVRTVFLDAPARVVVDWPVSAAPRCVSFRLDPGATLRDTAANQPTSIASTFEP